MTEKKAEPVYAITESERVNILAWGLGASLCEPFDPNSKEEYPIPDGEAILKDIGSRPLSCMERNGAQGQKPLAELEVLDELYKFVDGLDPDFIIRERISIIKARINKRQGNVTPSICEKCTSGTGPFCKGCHTLHQLPQYAPWPELRMIEALEHVASTESWTAMNAYIAECRKQTEERAKGDKNGKTN